MQIKYPKNRPLIMGILNLTPDSFSDGGNYNTVKKAVQKVKEMEQKGVDIIDIGGESSGPNSKDVSLKEELNRVTPVLKAIRKITQLPISVDTYKSEVARKALEEGANVINDITALRGDSKMATVIAKYKCPVILMYSKDKTARTTRQEKNYKDVVKTIEEFLEKRIQYAKKQRISYKQIILDPGMGHFVSAISKYSYEIIARLGELKKLGYPILLGLSRKSFLGGTIEQRETKAEALEQIAFLNGANIFRKHF